MKTIHIKYLGRKAAVNVRRQLNDPNWFCQPIVIVSAA